MLRLAIIGTGLIAHSNYTALRHTGEVTIVGLCNRTLEKGLAFREKYSLSCPVFTDYEALYQAVRPEAVLLCTPHDVHEAPFCYFAEKGVSVLLEKPVADQTASAKRMAALAQRCGTKATLCHTQRYQPCYQTAQAFLQSGKAQKLISVLDHITYNYFWEGRPQWFLDPARAGGGLIMNYGVHQLDRVHFLCQSDTVQLFAHLEWARPKETIDSSFHIMGIMENGVVYQLSATGYSDPFQSYTELRFQNGILRINLTESNFGGQGVFWGENGVPFQKLPLTTETPMYDAQMQAAVDYFLNKTAEPPIPLSYGARMVELCDLAKLSHQTGKAVSTR